MQTGNRPPMGDPNYRPPVFNNQQMRPPFQQQPINNVPGSNNSPPPMMNQGHAQGPVMQSSPMRPFQQPLPPQQQHPQQQQSSFRPPPQLLQTGPLPMTQRMATPPPVFTNNQQQINRQKTPQPMGQNQPSQNGQQQQQFSPQPSGQLPQQGGPIPLQPYQQPQTQPQPQPQQQQQQQQQPLPQQQQQPLPQQQQQQRQQPLPLPQQQIPPSNMGQPLQHLSPSPQQQQQQQRTPSPNLTSSMQAMSLQQNQVQPSRPVQTGPPGRSKRVYAVNPEVTGSTQQQQQPSSNAPWPHGLNPPQQSLPPLSKSPVMSSIRPNVNQPPYPSQTMTPPTVQQQQPSQIPPELRPPQQPKPRIDPDQMPAPVQVRQQDQNAFENQFFGTLERERVPLATTDYIGLDQGNCNPRYIRSTTDKMPYTKELADISKLPIGLIVQPLAKRRSDEVAIQTVDHGEEGPVRCSRCRAYVSPWCNFVQGGSKFICGICSHSNDVPSWYFANTDMSGRRIDIEQRPELRYGSVDFQVPPDYNSARKPAPLSYVFAIDVSASSIQSGMVKACCEALKIALYSTTLDHPKLPSSNKIGILTYDKSVHFYNLHPSLSQAQMLVVPDIDDVFIPLQDGFLADTVESKDIIIELLDTLPIMFQERPCPESVFTSAIRGGLQALQQSGGQLFVFQSCLPNFGSDALKSRDDKNIYNTDKEKTLMQPQSDVYKELAKECVKNAVSVNTWFFPAQYCDVSTVGIISELTGGDVRYYPNFNFTTDALIVQHQLDHDVHREIGFDGVLRIRCSDGLQVVDHYGNCNMATYTDMELATVDEDKAIAAVLKHDNKLDISRGATFQCALLYTTKDGHRRVRVHNLNLTVTSEIADVFRHGDIETTVSIILRKAIFDLQHKNRKEIHQKLTEQCVQILTAYRTNCASSTSPGQLILPEAFKLLPVYVHSAIRSKALRGVGTDMNVDCRSAGTRLFNTLSVRELVWTLYPRLYPLHTMDKECGQHGLNGYIKLPSMMRASYDRLDAGGAYLLDTGSDLYLWLGKNISETFLQNLFNVSSIDQVDPKMTLLPGLDTDLSHQVHSIARKLQSDRARYLQFHVIRQDLDPLEFIFSTWMAEDRNAEVQTYVDYMCVLHRKIQEEMKKNT